jgi:predicted nuclease of predicted toxin-antitoxin system
VSQVALDGRPDSEVFNWAQENGYLIVTFDEDFADQRSFPVGQHYGVIRLRVWPTTIEETQNGLSRLLEQSDDSELAGSLVIIGQHHIRVRRPMTG